MRTIAAFKSDAIYHNVDWDEIERRTESIIDSGKGGAVLALALNVPGVALKSVVSASEARTLGTKARDVFNKAHSPEEAFSLLKKAGLDKYVHDDSLKDAAETHFALNPKPDPLAKELKNVQPTQMYPAAMRRRKDGDLHISFERPIADGIEPGTVKLLDPFSKGSSMGKIEYRVDDQGITIDKLNVGKFTEGKNYITDYETVT
ncbi:MAG: hypothetical protein LBB22_04075, partial [Treponema sp.]|nr:hypothetical protein [Treponema sp.]